MRRIKWILILILALILLSLGKAAGLYTDWLWFKRIGYASVFLKILSTQVLLALLSGVFFLIIFYVNVILARYLSPKYVTIEQELIEIYRGVYRKYFNLILLVIALFFSAIAAGSFADQWNMVLRYLHQVPFKVADPIFHRDVGFYVFTLPFYRYLWWWVLYSLVVALLASIFVYWFEGAILFRRRETRLSRLVRIVPQAKAHLSVLCGLILVVIAWGYRLNIYELLYSPRGVAFGASYTDIHAQLPALKLLIIMSLFCAALFIINIYYRGWRLPVTGISLLILASIVAGTIYPAIVQQYRVLPNEIAKERPYIRLNIEYTRKAYDLNKIKEREFPATETLTLDDIRKNEATIKNVRLWDWRPLRKTYGQIQEIRLYYNFRDVDIDRYHLDGEYRQVTLSARELAQDQLPPAAKTWINRHLVYTHGHGLVMNPVNTVTPEGLPDLLIKDIPPRSKVNLKIIRPGIYYGEVANEYVIVKTKEREFDYPKGDKNKWTTYKGRGGVPVKSLLGKLAFALRFGSIKILLSDAITSRSRFMYYRQITQRVRKIAPFLYYDPDPYLVVSEDGKLYWIQDAYTITDMYPYSEPFKGRDFDGHGNYIRNSVKMVIDAYNGDVVFYLLDKEDPLINTYAKIFPDLFMPFEVMPFDLKKHVRYPEQLFRVQAQMYCTYHMQDPQVFYNKEDLWTLPEEIYEEGEQKIEPYYIIMRLPDHPKEEFILMSPFTPANRDNMIAWVCAKCDLPDYGELLVYKFPKEKLIYGPMQIEARINQHPEISRQLTLWGQRGSRVIRGNLLVIPIEQSLLYIEPLYLEAEQTKLPELKRVIVAFSNRIAMEENLETTLRVIFGEREVPRERIKPPQEEELPIGKLIDAAITHFNEAQERLKAGDWAGFGEEIKKLENYLKKLEEQT
ncbi:MAG: UPF0182 family protein [Actinomycetota bacterium]